MSVRVAINGFGRTGRAAFRAAYERDTDIEWVAINDLADPATDRSTFEHDTVYGPFDHWSRSAIRRSSWTATASKRHVSPTPPSLPGTSSTSTSSSKRLDGSAPAQTPPSTSPARGR